MKNTILIFAVLASFSVSAGGVDKETCNSISSLAGTIMKARQNGVEISEVLSKSNGNSIAEYLAIMAYKEPKFSSPAYINESIIEFKNSILIECYGSIKAGK